MNIINRTDVVIAYELRGGPHMMTLSECDLDPGESELWESPYRHHIDLRLRITVGDVLLERDVELSSSVAVVSADGAYVLQAS